MRVFFERFLCVLALAVFPLSAQAQQTTLRIIVFGDSLTSGYQLPKEDGFPAKLERKLQAVGYTNIEVLNMSADGESTSAAAERLNQILVKRPDIVVVELGSNDALRGINIDLINSNLGNIVSKLLQQRIYVVLMGVKIPDTRDPSYAGQHFGMYQKLADFYRMAYYPNTLEGIYGNPDMTLADGYHPNGKGSDVMVEGVYRMVDAGLRWKWDQLNAQSQYEYDTNPNRGVSAPLPVAVDPLPKAPSAAQ